MTARLQQRFPSVDRQLLTYILNDVSGGNESLAEEQLRHMSARQLQEIQASLGRQRRGSLTPQQQSRVREFCSIAGVGEKQAVKHLSRNDWNLEAALNVFFQGGGGADEDSGKIVCLFEECKKVGVEDGAPASEDSIQGNGLVHFCQAIGVEPFGDPLILIFAWLIRAADSYQFSRSEFVDGLLSLGCRSVEDIRAQVPSWRREISQPAKWKDFYKFCFEWSKPSGQRSLGCEEACELWKMLYSEWPRMPEWCDYVMDKHKKAISRDVWQQFHDLRRQKPDFSDYDAEGGAWPVLFDDFVTHCRESKAGGAGQ